MPSALSDTKTRSKGKRYRIKHGNGYGKTELIRPKSIFYRAFLQILTVAAGFFLGGAPLPFGVFPCGTALVCASGRYISAFLGSALASLFYEHGRGAFFAVNTLTLFSRMFLSSYRKSTRKKDSMILAVSVSALCGVLIAFSGGFEAESILSGASYFVFLPAVTWCFCAAPKRTGTVIDGVFYAVLYLAVFSLSDIFVGALYPGLMLSSFAVLFCARAGGCLYGMLTGLLCGTALGGVGLAISLGTAGAVSGMFFENRSTKVLSCVSFIASFSAVALYLLSDEGITLVTSAVCSAVLYIPLSELLPKVYAKKLVSAQSFFPVEKYTRYLEKLSSALSSVSDIAYNVSDKLRYPDETEIRRMADDTVDSFCRKCSMYGNCYSRKLYKSENISDIVCTRLSSGGLEKSDLPEKYADSCIALTGIVGRLNDAYRDMVNEYFTGNKTEILASEYSTMARLIKYTSHKTKSDVFPDPQLEKKAHQALCSAGVRFNTVTACGRREKTVTVTGVRIDKFPCTSSELSAYMSKTCGYLFDEPEFSDMGETCVMKLKRKRKLKLEYAVSACAKGGNAVNGDTASFFENDEDYFYALISDGMGSGRSAALTSRLTSVFIEKLLTTGTHKNVTLEMLNNLLLSKNDESFATVDLLEIDLLSGEASFVKAGAAPAYIIRASKLYKIASFTPPAGIIRSFSAENTRFSLEKGDTVLMLSDGIVQSSDEVPWLCELLSCKDDITPSELCEKILYKARKFNLREDDMTCVAVKVV